MYIGKIYFERKRGRERERERARASERARERERERMEERRTFKECIGIEHTPLVNHVLSYYFERIHQFLYA